jgi:hypothetical protein
LAFVGRWSFDNVLIDSSGQSPPNNATSLQGGATYDAAGKFGAALSLNGTTGYVSIPDSNSLDLTTGFTISVQLKPSATINALRYALIKNNSLTGPLDGTYWIFGTNGFCGSGEVVGGFYQQTDVNACHAQALPTAAWTHIALTYNPNATPNLQMYRNGQPQTTAFATQVLSVGTGNLFVGQEGSNNYYWQGLIDEVQILNGALPLTGPQDGNCTTTPNDPASYSIIRLKDCPINPVSPTAPTGLEIGSGGTISIGTGGSVQF